MPTKSRRSFRLIGSGRFTWDIPSTAGGAQSTTTVNIPGAVIGDAVLATPDTAQSGFLYDGRVTAPTTITLRAVNASGSTADPASTSITVVLLRP
jgi:predicted phage tail protein